MIDTTPPAIPATFYVCAFRYGDGKVYEPGEVAFKDKSELFDLLANELRVGSYSPVSATIVEVGDRRRDVTEDILKQYVMYWVFAADGDPHDIPSMKCTNGFDPQEYAIAIHDDAEQEARESTAHIASERMAL